MSRRINKHGFCGRTERAPEYDAWRAISRRCNNPNDRAFHNYGGRGIRICDDWRKDFLAFFNHIGPRPSKLHTLERINNDGHYEPGNVRWATRREQAFNRRSNRYIAIEEIDYTPQQLAKQLGIKVNSLYWRMRHWPMSRVLGIDQAYEAYGAILHSQKTGELL